MRRRSKQINVCFNPWLEHSGRGTQLRTIHGRTDNEQRGFTRAGEHEGQEDGMTRLQNTTGDTRLNRCWISYSSKKKKKRKSVVYFSQSLLTPSHHLVYWSIMGDCVSFNAWQGIPIISCGFSHIQHTSSVRDNMTEHSQVRWAILLSFTTLKVSRMKRLPPFVSQCWPWLQVIKALLSFCQSSDSPNISPWLISAVSSVRA